MKVLCRSLAFSFEDHESESCREWLQGSAGKNELS